MLWQPNYHPGNPTHLLGCLFKVLDRVNRVVHMLMLSPLLFLMMPPALFVSGSSGSFLSSDFCFLQPPLLWIHSSTLFREKKVVRLSSRFLR